MGLADRSLIAAPPPCFAWSPSPSQVDGEDVGILARHREAVKWRLFSILPIDLRWGGGPPAGWWRGECDPASLPPLLNAPKRCAARSPSPRRCCGVTCARHPKASASASNTPQGLSSSISSARAPIWQSRLTASRTIWATGQRATRIAINGWRSSASTRCASQPSMCCAMRRRSPILLCWSHKSGG